VKTGAIAAPDATLLRSLPFLKGLRLRELQTLADYSMQTTFPAGELVFREGELANRFYLLLTGRVVLESPVNKNETVSIETLGPGDVLGWSWLFPPYRWHFNARVLEPVSAIFFYGTRLREQCQTDPGLGYALVRRMAEVMMERLQATRRQLSQTSALALHLQREALRLAEQTGAVPRVARKRSPRVSTAVGIKTRGPRNHDRRS
jgi:CRP/FNR family transcriptional regulator, cyclic AMP receptor protein